MRRVAVIGALLAASLCGTAAAQGFGGFGNSPFERDYSDMKYLDSYFGTFGSKLEVAPGDQNVPFTVVLANVGTQDITGIRGELSLPYGFSPAEGSGLVAEADSHTNSRAGEIFHVTFYVDVAQHAEIREYPAAVKLEYSRIRESGVRNSFFDFYFTVPGSSILHVQTMDQFLFSLQPNTVRIQIINNGTAPLSNVDVRTPDEALSQGSSLGSVVVYESSWDLGNVGPSSSETITMTAYIPETLSGQTLRLPLEVSYVDAHGDAVSEVRTVDFYVRGLVELSVYGIDTFSISDTTMIVGEVINEGNEDALFTFVTVDPAGDSNISTQTQFLDEIGTDSPVPFNVPLEFEGPPSYGEHDVVITVRYKDDMREEHFLTRTATVTIPEPPPVREESVIPGLDVDSPAYDPQVLIAAAVAVAIIVAILAVLRRRSRK